MKKIIKLLKYLKGEKKKIYLYFFANLFAVIFSLVSFAMLAPVLQLLFIGQQPTKPGSSGLIETITAYVNEIVAEQSKLTALTYVVVLVVIFTILKNLFIYLAQYILNPLRNAVMRKLRDDLFSKTLSLPIGFFTEERKGDLISRMTNDVNEVEVSIMSVLATLIREPITIIFTLIAMVWISPQLTLFLLLFLPFAGYLIGKIGRSLKKPSNLAQMQLADMMSTLEETLSGMRVLKAFNAERNQHLRFRELNNNLYRTQNKIAVRREAGSPLSETLGIIVVCIILWYGGYLIFNQHSTTLTGPWFITFIGLFYQIINPLKNLSGAVYNIQKGTAALDRINELLEVENTIKEIENPVAIQEFNHEIVFNQVNFSFGKKEILKNIHLNIPKGKVVALVGASGAGKSTLVDLIPRFHDVLNGAITIDGQNIRDLKVHDLRRLIGVVAQDPILFNDTIYNNIILGTGGATKEQVEYAAKVANAHEFILQKKEGYQTIVGDRGSRLSGGERQRITIARAVLKNPPILILDEATSSLDTSSERIVQEALYKLMQNRTSIVIAHRLSTVQDADEIIVMNQGEIVERGNHQQLIKLNGFYYNLVQMQQLR